jgi:hypothetical protein
VSRFLPSLLLLLLGACAAPGQAPAGEPKPYEIEHAFRSKIASGGLLVRWEMYRIKEVRGWSLKFKRVHEEKSAVLIRRRYQATAKKAGTCAGYTVVESIPLHPAPGPQVLRHTVTVEPSGVRSCR